MKNLFATFLLLLLAFAGRAQEKNFIDQPYVEVTGSADTSVTPDEIYLRIFIAEADSKNRISLEAQEAQMVTALKGMSINTEKDLTVGDAGSNFGTYFIRGKQVLKTKTYTLKVDDAGMIDKVMQKLEAIDISNVSISELRYSDSCPCQRTSIGTYKRCCSTCRRCHFYWRNTLYRADSFKRF
jgi:hypothetical protein